MKTIKYIDFWAQSLMFAAVIGILLLRIGVTDALLTVLYMQLLVGPWQVVSSILSVGFRSPFHKFKAVHLVVSGIYLSILFGSPLHKLPREVALVIVMVPAWTLAIFYYVLTGLAAFYKPPRLSSFLPHTSF